MKRIHLFLLLLVTSVMGFAQSNLSTTFDFTNPVKLNPTITPSESYVYVMDKVFKQGLVSISFSYVGNGGTANIYTYTNPYTEEISYHLRCSQGTVITISTDEDAVLDSLRFSDSSVMGRFMLQYGQPGTYSNTTKSWQSNSKTARSVSFVNNGNLAQIHQLTIYYTSKPATLSPTSFSPANGSTMESFESLTMGFSSNMSIQDLTGIKIDGPGVTGGLSTTVSGKNVILTAAEPITVDGHYTITIPSRCFKNDAGYENVPITYSFTISHVKPANLYPISVTPANGSTLSDFQVLQLNYSYDMTAQNTSGIYISGPGLSANMNAVVYGKTIYLSVPQPITTDGYYTITMPEKCFTNAEGYGNASYNYNFTIKSQRNTFQMLSSDPAAGTVTSIPNGFTLLFEDIVGGVNPANAQLKIVDSKGNTVRNVTAARQGNSGTQSKTVVFTFKSGLGDITEPGTYTFVLPEQVVYNIDFDENASDYGASAGAVYNPEISLTFTIESSIPDIPDSETMLAAKALLEKKGIGYPADNSNGRNALSTAISNPDNIVVSEELDALLVEAMNQFYAETDVTMPKTGSWYKIVGVNSAGNKLYLGYANGKISLKPSDEGAGAFKATVSGNTIVFETSDGKYLHVPTASNSYVGTSSSGVTDAKTYLNNLTVTKLTVDGVDDKDILGLFKIFGPLGTEQSSGEAAGAYALINHGSTIIATDAAETLHYESSLSNAFTFIETTKPQEDTGIKPTITLSPSKLLDSSEAMTMTFTNISKAILADDTKPFIAKDDKGTEVVATTGKVLKAVQGKDNEFSVHVDGIAESGLYYLILPPGTFDFSQNEQTVYDRENVRVSFILDLPEDKPTLTPSASLSASSVEAGSILTLTISNGGTVTLKDATKAKYTKGTSSVSFAGTILTKASADNSFTVNTTGLEAGNYTLVLPAGTFSYEKEGYNIEDKEMSVSITITSKSTLTPSASLSATSIDAGSSLTLTISNGGTVTLKDATKAYYKKGTSTVSFAGTILTKASADNSFAVNTTGLEAGNYTLVLPAGTFAYSKDGSNIEDKEMSVSITINSTSSGSGNFNYSYNRYSYNLIGCIETKTDDYIADTYLNDFILYSYVPQDYTGLVADPTKVVKVVRYRTGTVAATGHFETYSNFSKDYPDYDGRVAIRLVLDKPFNGGELKDAAGLYTFEIPEATFGDANFGKYLKKPSSVKPQNCIVNPEIKDLMFQLDNKKAVPYPQKPTLTPSAKLFATTVDAGESLFLTINNGGTVKLEYASRAYYKKGSSVVSFTGYILSKASADNTFIASTTGLEAGKYTLVLPAGTFSYEKEGYNIEDKEMSVSFTINPTSEINGISSREDDGSYYDLSGRKVSTPTKKGIYIKNGRKVVVK